MQFGSGAKCGSVLVLEFISLATPYSQFLSSLDTPRILSIMKTHTHKNTMTIDGDSSLK